MNRPARQEQLPVAEAGGTVESSNVATRRTVRVSVGRGDIVDYDVKVGME